MPKGQSVSSGQLYSLAVSSGKIDSFGSNEDGGCQCTDCVKQRTRESGQMWVQRYYGEGTRPAAQAPRALRSALFGVRDFIYKGGTLYSTYIENIWVTGKEQRALCVPMKPHRAPHPACRCGLYGFYNREAVLARGDDYVRVGDGVRGVVSAWGDIVLHESGFRSEYMRLEALIYEPNTISFLGEEIDAMPVYEKICKCLEVPLIIPEEIESFAREQGLLVLTEQTRPELINSWQRAGSLPRASGAKGVESEAPVPLAKDPWQYTVRLDPIKITNPQRPLPPPVYDFKLDFSQDFSQDSPPSWWGR